MGTPSPRKAVGFYLLLLALFGLVAKRGIDTYFDQREGRELSELCDLYKGQVVKNFEGRWICLSPPSSNETMHVPPNDYEGPL